MKSDEGKISALKVPGSGSLDVGVTSDGLVSLHITTARGEVVHSVMTLELAEWLRNRLFHICARERAFAKAKFDEDFLSTKAESPKPKASSDV